MHHRAHTVLRTSFYLAAVLLLTGPLTAKAFASQLQGIDSRCFADGAEILKTFPFPFPFLYDDKSRNVQPGTAFPSFTGIPEKITTDSTAENLSIGKIRLTSVRRLSPSATCQIDGQIYPDDADMTQSQPDKTGKHHIEFSAQFPQKSSWNGKALQMGGGGFDGSVSLGTNPYLTGNSSGPSDQGYLIFGSDSGHQGGGIDGTFAQDQVAFSNFAGNSLKRTHDVVMYLAKQVYGKLPGKTYFAGGSSGGREALTAISRWPDDYQGAIAFYPAVDYAALMLQFGMLSTQLGKPSGGVPGWQGQKLGDLISAACAGDDGTRVWWNGYGDGLISNPGACREKLKADKFFTGDSSTNKLINSAGFNVNQIATINAFQTDPVWPDGRNYSVGAFYIFAGANPFTLTVADSGILLGGAFGVLNSLGGSWPWPGTFFWNGAQPFFGNNSGSYDASNDPGLTAFYKKYKDGVDSASAKLRTDPAAAGLKKFLKNGKLIMMHGMADMLVPTQGSVNYFKSLQQAFPDNKDNARLYLVPNMNHGFGAFTPVWDSLADLDNWVTNATSPTPIVTAGAVGMDKYNYWGNDKWPLCAYPKVMQYSAQVQPSGTHFTCVTPTNAAI